MGWLWWLSLNALALLIQSQYVLCTYAFKRLVVVSSLNSHKEYFDFISEDKETFVFPLDTLSQPERLQVALSKINELHQLLGTEYMYEQLNQRLKENSRAVYFFPKTFLFHSLGPSLFEFQNLLYSYCDKEPETIDGNKIKIFNINKLLNSEVIKLLDHRNKIARTKTLKTFTLPSDPQHFSLGTLKKNILNFGLMLMLESVKRNQCESIIQAKELGNVQNMIFKKDLKNIELEQRYDTIVLPLEVLTPGTNEFFKLEKFVLRYRERYLGKHFITDRLSKNDVKQQLKRFRALGKNMIPCLEQISLARERSLRFNEDVWSIPKECIESINLAPALFETRKMVRENVKDFFLVGENPTRVEIFFARALGSHFPWFIIFEWLLNLVQKDLETLFFEDLSSFNSHLLFPSYLSTITETYGLYLKGKWKPLGGKKSGTIDRKGLHTRTKLASTSEKSSSKKHKGKNRNINVQGTLSNSFLENTFEQAGTSSRKRKNSKDNASLSNPSKRFKPPTLVVLERKDSNPLLNPQPSTSKAFPDQQTVTNAVQASEIPFSTQTSNTDPDYDSLISTLDFLRAENANLAGANHLEAIGEFLQESMDNESI